MGVSLRDVGLGIVLAAVLLQGWNLYQDRTRRTLATKLTTRDTTTAKSDLKKLSEVLEKKRIIQVAPRLHLAMGYALANVVMIEGEDGVIIVDVTESMEAAREVREDFKKITTKPVKAIIYTHNHPDHVNGAKAFVDEGQVVPEIWAHAELTSLLERQNYVGTIFYARAMRQFGILIQDTINAGIGFQVRLRSDGSDNGLIYPNKFMRGIEKDITVAGVNMKLVHIPGETEDQIGVWLPQERAFLCADDVYEAFPNLYAIRGTPTRDTLHWYTSIDRILSFKPEHLVPSHTRPVKGEATIRELLTGYRDAIQYVHDQTIRYMNKGYLPDEIAQRIHLPEHLAAHPYLQEFYGTVHWSVKGVFNSYMGWFSGDPVDLTPLTPTDMAERTVKLAGGVNIVTSASEDAAAKENWQWGLVLSSYVLRVDSSNQRAKEVKVKCLMALGDQQTSSNGRNYYFTAAMETLGQVSTRPPKSIVAETVRTAPLNNLFQSLQVRYNVEECGVINSTVHFRFTDTQQDITLTARNSVILISDRPPTTPAAIKVTTTSKAWRDTMTSSFSGLASLATGSLKVEGGLGEFRNFMSCFDSV